MRSFKAGENDPDRLRATLAAYAAPCPACLHRTGLLLDIREDAARKVLYGVIDGNTGEDMTQFFRATHRVCSTLIAYPEVAKATLTAAEAGEGEPEEEEARPEWLD